MEEEQFTSSEQFMAAESALDWDALATRGNSKNQTQGMTKWERESLYQKFDPLVGVRNINQGDRDSFIFKMPKAPGPSSTRHDQSAESEEINGNVQATEEEHSRTVDSIPEEQAEDDDLENIIENMAGINLNKSDSGEKMKSPEKSVIPPSPLSPRNQEVTEKQEKDLPSQEMKDKLDKTFSPRKSITTPEKSASPQKTIVVTPEKVTSPQKTTTTPEKSFCPQTSFTTPEKSISPQKTIVVTPEKFTSPQKTVVVTPEKITSPQKTMTEEEKSLPPQEVAEKQEESLPPMEVDVDEKQEENLSPPEVTQKEENYISPQKAIVTQQEKNLLPQERIDKQEKDLSPSPSPPPHEKPSGTAQSAKPSKPQQQKQPKKPVNHPYANKLAIISERKKTIAQATADFAKTKKQKQKHIAKLELQLKQNVEEYGKMKERHEKAIEERDAAIEQRNDAKHEVANTEKNFAEMLMLYETVKHATSDVEENIAILEERCKILEKYGRKREALYQACENHADEVFEIMRRDFESQIREREAESVKLKAKVRMCELKTSKLEAEIVHVDRESEKLRALCEDLMKN